MSEVIIMGTGISGLMSAVMLAESGISVLMLSYYEGIRSASCMAQGGINAFEPREKDSAMKHFTETIVGGAWLADQKPVMEMCEFAPRIISMYDRIGVAFNRNKDGSPDTRFFGGAKYKRAHYADTMTGAQLLNALDGQVRFYEEKGLIQRFSGKDFVAALMKDNGSCCGCIVQDIYTMKMEAYTGSALIVASGGYTSLYSRSTSAVLSNGAVAGQLLLQGIPIANPEFVQFHPTAMVSGDKSRLISESARGEGGRVYVMREGKPWYFLEDMYPEQGNLVTRDTASRAIHHVVHDLGLGVDGKNQVYLDISQLPKDVIEQNLSNVADLYEKFSGENPRKKPMKVYPSPHYTMGGIYVDSNHRTDVKGLYACGECDYMYHGGNRLGGNSLLSATYSGYTAAKTVIRDWEGGRLPKDNTGSDSWIQNKVKSYEKEQSDLQKRQGKEHAGVIASELGAVLMKYAGIIRNNKDLEIAGSKIENLKERLKSAVPDDRSSWGNSSIISLRKMLPRITLAQSVIAGALARNESRGAHYKLDFPKRDDKNWLKTTIARYDSLHNRITLDYKPVDVSILPPR